MRKLFVFLFIVVFFVSASAQETGEIQIINHEVMQGETVRMLSKRYLVTPSDIYKLNPFAVDGISKGMVLQIPSHKKPTENDLRTASAVQKKATAAIEIDAVNSADVKAVEAIMDSLSVAPDRTEAAGKTVSTDEKSSGNPAKHKVMPGETLSSISRKYGVTVDEIKNANSNLLARGLQSGQVIEIPGSDSSDVTPTAVHEAQATAAPIETSSDHTVEHIVQPKETLYSISKKYNVTVDQIQQLNEKSLAHGLQAGQVILIKPNN